MLDEKIKCCALFDAFLVRHRGDLCFELSRLEEDYVLEVRGTLHVDEPASGTSDSSCGSGCISCGPPKVEKTDTWRAEPFEMVWRHCPFCGGNFVRPDL